jgi:hypothetical protein
MAMTEWMIRGPEITTCNCDYSCPCQFNALPTQGHCNAAVAMRIDRGNYGKVKLDGLHWAVVLKWPGPIHMGKGHVQPIVDKRATAEQREAILKILSGEDTEPGATIFQVFSTTYEKMYDPIFETIEFESDMKTCKGRFSVPGVVEAQTDSIKNPVTGKPHHPKISIREGFEYTEAEVAAGTARSTGAIVIDNQDKHAHLAMLHMTGKGVVH